ncbi:MAG: hypothetical protein LBU89_12365 [Fibromonadaceae bacterium]|jgi:uncharacterized protein (TIGR02145 family)|nr:hypothetical protein [Fibromonadaceae bacterium]
MSNKFLILLASFAMALMVSCSGDDGKDGSSCIVEPNAKSGFDVVCDGEKVGELTNGQDSDCSFNPIPETDSLIIICNHEEKGRIANGKDGKDGEDGKSGIDGTNCLVSEEGVYLVMKCEDEKIAEWPKAMCGTSAYDPAEMACDRGILSFNFTDERDNKKYKAVVIGNQTWMAENLNYSGAPDTTLGLCYAEGLESPVSADSIAKNCARYGRLYDWATVMALGSNCNSVSCQSDIQSKHQGICPSGWHVPLNSEWLTLLNFVGGHTLAAPKLKATSGWNSYTSYHQVCVSGNVHEQSHNNLCGNLSLLVSGNGTDDYGFSALPGGYIWQGSSSNYSYNIGTYSFWWTSSENENSPASANYRYIYNANNEVYGSTPLKTNMYSLRCVKN